MCNLQIGHATPTPLEILEKADKLNLSYVACTCHAPTLFILINNY